MAIFVDGQAGYTHFADETPCQALDVGCGPASLPSPQTKVTTMGSNEIYKTEYLIGPLLVHKLLGPRPQPAPLLSPDVSLPPFGVAHVPVGDGFRGHQGIMTVKRVEWVLGCKGPGRKG